MGERDSVKSVGGSGVVGACGGMTRGTGGE